MFMRIAYALSLFLAAHTRVSVLDLRRIRPSGKRRTRSIRHARKNGLKDTGRNLKETAPSKMDLYISLRPSGEPTASFHRRGRRSHRIQARGGDC